MFNIETLAVMGTGLFFLYKYLLGYWMINVTLETSARRISQKNDDDDVIVITVKIRKGDRECLQLNRLSLTVQGEHGPLPGASLDFKAPPQKAPAGRLRLSPGEECAYELAIKAPKFGTCTVDIELLGWCGPFTGKIPGYWRARLISVPGDPNGSGAKAG